jgi:hypothetical protein
VNPGFVDPSNFDYHLTSGSPAIDAGTSPGVSNNSTDFTPRYEYVDQAAIQPRPMDGTLDIGAFESVGTSPGSRLLADAGNSDPLDTAVSNGEVGGSAPVDRNPNRFGSWSVDCPSSD